MRGGRAAERQSGGASEAGGSLSQAGLGARRGGRAVQGTMRGGLPLLAVLALLAARGGAAPLQAGGTAALTKIYPRGSHWAVGHLMGKKSTGDFPYEEEKKSPLSAIPDDIKQLEEFLQWEEVSKYLLRLLERNENRSSHFLKGGLPWYSRSSWETDDNSSWKHMMDYLLQAVNMKESTPS